MVVRACLPVSDGEPLLPHLHVTVQGVVVEGGDHEFRPEVLLHGGLPAQVPCR